MAAVRVRRGYEDDLDRLEPLWLALHRHDREVSDVLLQADDEVSWRVRRGFYSSRLADEGGVLFVAVEVQAPVGYAFALLNDAPDDTWGFRRGWSEIYSLVVAQGTRSRGVGSRLLEAVAEDARNRGYDGLTVATMTGNHEALEFYRHRGFRSAEMLLIRAEL